MTERANAHSTAANGAKPVTGRRTQLSVTTIKTLGGCPCCIQPVRGSYVSVRFCLIACDPSAKVLFATRMSDHSHVTQGTHLVRVATTPSSERPYTVAAREEGGSELVYTTATSRALGWL